MISAKNALDFPGIKVRECKILKRGMGVCIPPLGIFVHEGASVAIQQHEYGHYLQYQELGFLRFYFFVGIPSLWSATLFPRTHNRQSYERDANRRSRVFYGEYSELVDRNYWLD